MKRNLSDRVERLEQRTTRDCLVDLTPVPAEELERALSDAHLRLRRDRDDAVWMVSRGDGGAGRAEVMDQVVRVCTKALDVGSALLGSDAEFGDLLDAAFPIMFPDPRSAAATAMMDAIRSDQRPLVAIQIVTGVPRARGAIRAG